MFPLHDKRRQHARGLFWTFVCHCHLSILLFFQGGLLAGPAGTGKTETIKDLAKSVGKMTIVFNCSESVDHSIIANLLSGVLQVGLFLCW